MLIPLLFNDPALFFAIGIVIVLSLSFHEWGHAASAKYFGDDTAERMGRLTFNPIAHIDPMGLLMVMTVGFGFAKPVPTNPRNFNSYWADFFVSAAGPFMNLLIAIIAANVFTIGAKSGFFTGYGSAVFFDLVVGINLVLFIFNLIPLGPLDGHYIMPYLLSKKAAQLYVHYNHRFGSFLLLGLVVLSLMGVPVFQFVWSIGNSLRPYINFFA